MFHADVQLKEKHTMHRLLIIYASVVKVKSGFGFYYVLNYIGE